MCREKNLYEKIQHLIKGLKKTLRSGHKYCV